MLKILLFCLLTSSIFAQQKIAVVDYDSVMQAHPLFGYGQELQDSLGQELQNTLLEKQAQLEDYYEEVMERISYGCGGSPAQQKAMQDSLVTLQVELQELALYADELYNTIVTDYEAYFRLEIQTSIQQIGIENQLTLILERQKVVFHDETIIDITTMVIQWIHAQQQDRFRTTLDQHYQNHSKQIQALN